MASLYFPAKTIQKMSSLGISESDVYDVYNHGEYGKMSDGSPYSRKKYNGYEIGCMYVTNARKEIVIIAVWKRDRR